MFTDITERKQTEEALQRHTEDLARLHRELDSANREANLYLDILTHDIRNTENVANLYTELLIETLDGDSRTYMEKLQRSIRKSIEILGNVSTIRRIHQPSGGHKRVDLDTVIRDEIAQFPEIAIHYEAVDRQVLADDLLSEVFSNLIGNAVKFGGSGVEITVRVEDEDGFVRVSVEDTGPGVPDDQKREIFHRYEKRRRGVGEGLGLFLVQVLIERYGGRIWVDDRVPGTTEAGAAFRFTLQKVVRDEPGAPADGDVQGCRVPLIG
ncbi:MAG: HAMP domain-containing histidine kinase [Methanoculleus marisnigri]|nr:HAMP domain-containing histidine kinase [Methanoculleus marisnigri]